MPFNYDKLLNLLKEKGFTTYKIRKDNLISQSAWQKIRTGTGDIDTRTLERLCNVLECQPGDMMEYVPAALDTEPDTGHEATTMRVYKAGPDGWIDEEQ
ncbi:MAG: helix-turn-helix transcriptional regulator [Hydrogenoanaerobacterium sp.]